MSERRSRVVELRGITWNHDRGLAPLAATARSYGEFRPDVRVRWTARSLQEFADYPVDALAERYDLVVLDHPSIGYAVERTCLVALDDHLDPRFLEDQRVNSVGRSHHSYAYDGHQWALAIDAAAQVGAYRPDLLQALGLEVPRTWDDVMKATERTGPDGVPVVTLPLIPVDALMTFFSLCVADGADPLGDDGTTPDHVVRRRALESMARLKEGCHPRSLERNPPAMLEHMSTTDEIAYCPLAFGYSNYARPGFRKNLVRFCPAPAGANGRPSGTLGGAGLAVSARSSHRKAACEYAAYVASADVQKTLYFEAGGQPGHRGAWTDPVVNEASSSFFLDTLESLDSAYLRPRYDGYLDLQDQAGRIVHGFLREGGDPGDALEALDGLLRQRKPSS